MAILITILGLLLGSFLNVCIYRLPREESIISKPFHCIKCKSKLGILDLLPVVSYAFISGNCRYCGEKISFRYPLVELLTGLLFFITYFHIGFDILLIKYLFLFSLLMVITFIDIEHKIIPNQLVAIILIWAAIWQILYPQIELYKAVAGSLLGGGILLFSAIISRGGMGGGDIKFMFAAGFFLGISITALALFLAFLIGSIVGMGLIVLRIKSRKDPIPFGPFLSIGVFIAALWGYEIIDLYLSLIIPLW